MFGSAGAARTSIMASPGGGAVNSANNGGSTNATFNLLDLANATFELGFTQEPPGGNAIDPQQEDQADLKRIIFQVQITRFVVWRILVPMTVAFGVIGNCISIAVLTRRSMKTSTNVYLTALAICDVLYLVFAFSLGLKHFKTINDSVHYKQFRKPFGMALVDTFSNTGVWLTLTFTIERYIGVCHPMKGKVLCTPQRARYVVITVCICTFILTFPEFFSFRSVAIVRDNQTVVEYEPILEANDSYQWGFKYLHQVLFTLGPLISLLIFNSLLMRAVLSAAKQRRSMAKVAISHQNDRQDRHHREQQKITIMLIMVVIVFLLCQLPQAITNLYYTYLDVTHKLTTVVQYRIILTANVCNLLVMINSSTNFILYSAFSTKFRRTFRVIFCKCLVKKKAPDHCVSDMYSTDGSKTNLILRAQQQIHSHLSRSPRCKRAPPTSSAPPITTVSSVQNSNSSTSSSGLNSIKGKTKNGYLAVGQPSKGVSSV